jgi:hypothetical protein
MFYFKDAPLPPSKIVPEELARVQKFRSQLPDKGGLYGTFEDESGFQTSVRAHLAALAQEFSHAERSAGSGPVGDSQNAAEIAITEQNSDLGFLDYVELYESRMADLSATLESIGDATGRIGEQMTRRTEEVRNLSSDDIDPKEARRVVKRAADDMDGYADVLQKRVPLMTSARESALQALTQALAVYEDFHGAGEGDRAELREGLMRLREQTDGSHRGLVDFRETVAGLPRLTSEINRAKRNVIRQLDTMLEEISTTSDNVDNILDSLSRIEGDAH